MPRSSAIEAWSHHILRRRDDGWERSLGGKAPGV
jgi:hypothetical protein